MPLWSCILIISLALATLYILRLSAGYPVRSLASDGLDCLVGGLLWSAISLITLRPAASALLWAVLAAGLLLADRTKRAVLKEPIVFADASELIQLAFHPRFYLPYVHPALFYGVGGGLLILTGFLFSFEKPIFPEAGLMPRISGVLLIALPVWLYFTRSGIAFFMRCLSWLHSDGRLEHDLARFGMLGTFVVHTVRSRYERPTRRAACQFAPVVVPLSKPPIVLVQAESFFDIGRLDPDAASPLAHFSACASRSWACGELDVAAWGANTIRSEFAVLSGIPSEGLGLDSFNPYYAFAREKIDTLVWKLREAGYCTVCVHPYDRRFYGRHKVMRNLGFEYFYGREEFPGEAGRFVSDEALGRWINNFVARSSRPVFVFAITVANHGPWKAGRTGPFLSEFEGYVEGVRATDRMIGALASADWMRERQGVLAVYGDHQPSLPELSDAKFDIGLSTDYFILDGASSGSGRHVDIPVHELGAEIALCLATRATKGRAIQASLLPPSLLQDTILRQ